jgi:probable rRNA maturation factor
MTIFLEIDPTFAGSSELPDFTKCILAVFKDHGIPMESDATIVLVDDERIHELNQEFLGEDKPTDVLAFPADHIDPDTGHRNYGDVIISYPRAKDQALAAGHPLPSELSLLSVHGALHLLGFDHDNPESEAKMWHAQSKILNNLGIKVNSPYYSTHPES